MKIPRRLVDRKLRGSGRFLTLLNVGSADERNEANSLLEQMKPIYRNLKRKGHDLNGALNLTEDLLNNELLFFFTKSI